MREAAVQGLPGAVGCPECGSAAGLPVVYGMPGADLFAAADEGQVFLGGCVIVPEQPDYRCSTCGHEWCTDD